MTPDQINRKIAEKQGWVKQDHGCAFDWVSPSNEGYRSEPPNYYHSLDALRAPLLQVLTDPKLWHTFIDELLHVCNNQNKVELGDDCDVWMKMLLLATPEQLCEALLRTWGLWEEDKP